MPPLKHINKTLGFIYRGDRIRNNNIKKRNILTMLPSENFLF